MTAIKGESRALHVALWVVQVGLAVLFLNAGWQKLAMPAAALAAGTPMPVAFLRAIAVLELLGALGLVLPGLFRVAVGLTPIAASGLLLIMCGAVGTLMGNPATAAVPSFIVLPAVTGVFAAIVAYGRRRAPLGAGRKRVASPAPAFLDVRHGDRTVARSVLPVASA